MEKKIDITGALKYGWEIFKANPVQHILVILAVAIVNQLSYMLVGMTASQGGLAYVVANLVEFLTIGTFVGIFMVSYALYQTRKSEKTVGDILSSIFDFELWWKYVVAIILITIIVAIGMVLLIVPGIIASLGLMFATYYVIDFKKDPIEALKRSWELSNGLKWQLFIFVLALGLVNILGVLALFVGFFVSVPVTMFAFAHVYNELTNAYEGQDDSEDEQDDEDENNEEDEDDEEIEDEENELSSESEEKQVNTED